MVKRESDRKVWVYNPGARKALETQRPEIELKAQRLVEILKRKHLRVKPPRDDFNYLADIRIKWWGDTLYFCSTYRCPSKHALAPSFDAKFARLEPSGSGRFHLSFMRHTGQWVTPYYDISLDQCLKAIETDPLFTP